MGVLDFFRKKAPVDPGPDRRARPYPCLMCSRKFTCQEYLDQHEAMAHRGGAMWSSTTARASTTPSRGRTEASGQGRSPRIRYDRTKPNTYLTVPPIDGSLVFLQRRAHGPSAPDPTFQADLERIYTYHGPRNMRPSREHLVRKFQDDWNNDSLPIAGVRQFTNLPDLIADGIPDAQTQAAVYAYLNMLPPAEIMDNLTDTDALIDWIKNNMARGVEQFMDAELPENDRLAPEDIVDDLQDLLDELDDDPTT